jgi:hypothetical protein
MSQCTTISLTSRAAVVCAVLVVSPVASAEPSSVMAPKDPGTTGTGDTADSVRVQPRGKDFMPNSRDEAVVQERLKIFNSTQELQDAAFDRKLRICRGC